MSELISGQLSAQTSEFAAILAAKDKADAARAAAQAEAADQRQEQIMEAIQQLSLENGVQMDEVGTRVSLLQQQVNHREQQDADFRTQTAAAFASMNDMLRNMGQGMNAMAQATTALRQMANDNATNSPPLGTQVLEADRTL
jgi:hypothetical protein